MIKLVQLVIDNCLPFGENVVIDFTASSLTQLVGKNGSGKSSLPLLLEEVLFNKNSKGIPKTDILNRYSGKNSGSLELTFYINDDLYNIYKTIKAGASSTTSKVTLKKNGEDISGHTATQTYKLIIDLLGMDMTTFSKLVYQSIGSSLDFLTATDSNRKKFLIILLDLDKYAVIEKQVKDKIKEVKVELNNRNTSLNEINRVIKSTTIPVEVSLVPVPEFNREAYERLEDELVTKKIELSEKKSSLINEIENINTNNNYEMQIYKSALNKYNSNLEDFVKWQGLQTSIKNTENVLKQLEKDLTLLTDLSADIEKIESEYKCKTDSLNKILWEMDSVKKLYKQFTSEAEITECPACGSPLNKEHAKVEADKNKQKFVSLAAYRDSLRNEVTNLGSELKELKDSQELFLKAKRDKQKAETQLKDYELESLDLWLKLDLDHYPESESSPFLDPEEVFEGQKPQEVKLSEDIRSELNAKLDIILDEIKILENKIVQNRQELLAEQQRVENAREQNLAAEKTNARREALIKTVEDSKSRAAEVAKEITELDTQITKLETLGKIFGNKGLLAYKIESSVKVFESKVNEYLSDISNGLFALEFELVGSDLKVIVYSHGQSINIKTLSTGELVKVNISTLLAIRDLISTMSKNKLNLLFLDEVVSHIDQDGIEELINVLLDREGLNTFMVSHNYQHPLVNAVRVLKEGAISRLEV
jgi:DNA repair exonuclease SbcCD ATPase subunit